MDAIARIGAYFPFKSITVYFILSNVIINNVGDCATQQRQLMIALLFIFCVLNILSCFTDTYTASNQNKYWVFIIPGYGPLCFSLPSDPDKDLVYDNYYLRYRDYAHAFCSVTTFLLIIIFSNPISMCLCPSGNSDGTSRFDPAIIRTVPILIAIIMSMAMVCLGPPRQLLGMQNVQETCQPPERSMGDNPIYGSKYPEPSYRDGDDGPMDEEEGGHDVPQTSPSQRFKYGMSKDGTRTPPRYDQDGGKAAHGTPRQLSPRISTRQDADGV